MDTTRSLSSQECLAQVPLPNLEPASVYVTSRISIPGTEEKPCIPISERLNTGTRRLGRK